MSSGHCECLTHPQVSTGQGGEEEVAGLLQCLGGDERQQHKGVAHQRQQDDQPEYASCRHDNDNDENDYNDDDDDIDDDQRSA